MYHRFWTIVIQRHARRVIFLDGWEFSLGCVLEFEAADNLALDCVDEHLRPLVRDEAVDRIRSGILQIESFGRHQEQMQHALERLERRGRSSPQYQVRELYKDEVLDRLAATANVAQFVSFEAGSTQRQRFCRIRGFAPNHRFASMRDAVVALLERSGEGRLNIRSFSPQRPEGNPFVRHLGSADAVIGKVQELAEGGLFTIVNETIDEHDGGVSGVSYRGRLEFAPDATPRCVDDPDIEKASLPFELGMGLLRSVYGLEPDLRGREGARVEFSMHPSPRGWTHTHSIIWQSEQRPVPDLPAHVPWPNAFSRLLGDKAFGLAVAAAAGLPVPRTTVYSRRLFPFAFGLSTGSSELWTRTCPEEKVPGFYPSVHRWVDPYLVLGDWRVLASKEETRAKGPAPAALASVIVQEGVRASYSGRAVSAEGESPVIAGRAGPGDTFMVGESAQEDLPEVVKDAVSESYRDAKRVFGPVSLEWVFDGHMAWIVQVNLDHIRRREPLQEGIEWRVFHVKKGPQSLEDFRRQVVAARGTNIGLLVVGNVSPLSHFGEIADLHQVPARFLPELYSHDPTDSSHFARSR
jgi:hypothetical protein